MDAIDKCTLKSVWYGNELELSFCETSHCVHVRHLDSLRRPGWECVFAGTVAGELERKISDHRYSFNVPLVLQDDAQQYVSMCFCEPDEVSLHVDYESGDGVVGSFAIGSNQKAIEPVIKLLRKAALIAEEARLKAPLCFGLGMS